MERIMRLMLVVVGAAALVLGTVLLARAGVSSQVLTAPTIPARLHTCVLIAKVDKQSSSVVSGVGWNNFLRCSGTDFLWRRASGREGHTYDFSLGSETTVTFGQISSYCGVDTSSPIDLSSRTCGERPDFALRPAS